MYNPSWIMIKYQIKPNWRSHYKRLTIILQKDQWHEHQDKTEKLLLIGGDYRAMMIKCKMASWIESWNRKIISMEKLGVLEYLLCFG